MPSCSQTTAFMPDSKTDPDSKPRVSSKAINITYQLKAFIESGHRYSLALSDKLIDTISYITNEYKDLSPTKDHSVAACNAQKTRQGRSLSIEPLQYLSSWAIVRPAYTKSLKAFVDQTNNIQKYSKFSQGRAAASRTQRECSVTTDPKVEPNLTRLTTAPTSQIEPPNPAQIPGAFPLNLGTKPSNISVQLQLKPVLRKVKSASQSKQLLSKVEEESQTSADESIR